MATLRKEPSKDEGLKLTDTLRSTLESVFEKQYRTPGVVGIELEAEGNLYQINTPYWKTEVDGSLRNGGLEFILKKPVPMESLADALDQFAEQAKGMTFSKSIRTSCHVHMNVQPYTFKELYAIIGAYWLFEDILVEMCGRDRVGNLFCLRASDAAASVHWVVDSIKNTLTSWSRKFLLDFHVDHSKYAALNLSALARYGSLEFRSMRGIYTKKEISQWVNILHSLITVARADGSPSAVYQIFKDATPSGLVEHYFGQYASVIKEVPGWKDSVKKSSMFLAQLAHMANRAEKGEFERGPKSELRGVKAVYETSFAHDPASINFASLVTAAPPALPSIFLNDVSLTSLGPVDGEQAVMQHAPIWTSAQELSFGDS